MIKGAAENVNFMPIEFLMLVIGAVWIFTGFCRNNR